MFLHDGYYRGLISYLYYFGGSYSIMAFMITYTILGVPYYDYT